MNNDAAQLRLAASLLLIAVLATLSVATALATVPVLAATVACCVIVPYAMARFGSQRFRPIEVRRQAPLPERNVQ